MTWSAEPPLASKNHAFQMAYWMRERKIQSLTPDELEDLHVEDRRLCSECVGEAFLRAVVEKSGHDGTCSNCGGEGKTFSLEEVADEIEARLAKFPKAA